jgi:hypothetical protein
MSETETTTAEELAVRLLSGHEHLEPAEAARLLGELRAKWLNEAADLAAKQGGCGCNEALGAAHQIRMAARDFGPTMTLTLPHVPGVTGWVVAGQQVPPAAPEPDPHAPVEVVTARWGGEELWIDEDGTVGVPLTVDGRPVVLTLDDARAVDLAAELTDCHKANTADGYPMLTKEDD